MARPRAARRVRVVRGGALLREAAGCPLSAAQGGVRRGGAPARRGVVRGIASVGTRPRVRLATRRRRRRTRRARRRRLVRRRAVVVAARRERASRRGVPRDRQGGLRRALPQARGAAGGEGKRGGAAVGSRGGEVSRGRVRTESTYDILYESRLAFGSALAPSEKIPGHVCIDEARRLRRGAEFRAFFSREVHAHPRRRRRGGEHPPHF